MLHSLVDSVLLRLRYLIIKSSAQYWQNKKKNANFADGYTKNEKTTYMLYIDYN